MNYSKRTLENVSDEESEFLLTELSTLTIPDDLLIVQGGLRQKNYQDVETVHDLIEKLKKDQSKTPQDIECVYHVLGFLHYLGFDYDK